MEGYCRFEIPSLPPADPQGAGKSVLCGDAEETVRQCGAAGTPGPCIYSAQPVDFGRLAQILALVYMSGCAGIHTSVSLLCMYSEQMWMTVASQWTSQDEPRGDYQCPACLAYELTTLLGGQIRSTALGFYHRPVTTGLVHVHQPL